MVTMMAVGFVAEVKQARRTEAGKLFQSTVNPFAVTF
jgi:hypothetical protein